MIETENVSRFNGVPARGAYVRGATVGDRAEIGWEGVLHDAGVGIEGEPVFRFRDGTRGGTIYAEFDILVAEFRDYFAGLVNRGFCTYGACDNPGHDHTTTIDGEGLDLRQPVPMFCNDCGVLTHYDEADHRYHHDDPDAEPCWLTANC